jgi:hypothetical protein
MKPELKVVASNTLEDVAKCGLVYLATPYSKYPTGIEMAFRDACVLTGRLLRSGVKVYSPIAHTHPIAIHGKLDPHDHSIWLPFDKAVMDKADVLLVAKMPSWEASYGIAEEIKVFRQAGKPIYYLDHVNLDVTHDCE